MKIATLITAAALGCGALGGQAAAEPARVDPAAVAALTRMSAYLRSIPAFQVTLTTQRDDVDAYGQLITLAGGAVYRVRRPDAFAFDISLPSQAGRYVYDGKTVSAYDSKNGSYASFQAPPTIRGALEFAQRTYGASVPLDDLFTWSEGDSRANSLTSAHYIGKSQIEGRITSHYAFRQRGIDWQIWILDGDKPAPLRVSLVASDDPARPKFQADLAWDTAPRFSANTFAFAPPRNARAISLQPVH